MMPNLFEAFWKRRATLIAFLGVVAAVATGVAFLLPTWYRAQSTLLPPQENGDATTSIASMIESSALSRVGFVSTGTPSDVFKEILESRTLMGSLIRRFDLSRRYHQKGMERTLKELAAHLSVSVRASGVLVLQVEDRDPHTAAEMANYLIAELDRFNRETYNTRAKRTRVFLEGRIAATQARLNESEDLLTAYERKHGVVADEDVSAARGVGDALARKLSLQIQRAYVSSYSQPDNPDLRELDASLAAVDQELAKLPPVKQEGARLAMEAAIQRKVFTLLTGQYEEANVQEQRDTPTLTVLDTAEVPEMKCRPHRAVIIVVSVAAAAALAAGWVLFQERHAFQA
jgi:tyrosine-protein kinase Etk/Wzc